MGRVALVIAALLLVAAQGVAAPSAACQEKGWYIGLIFSGDDGVSVVGHGPLSAWAQQSLLLDDGASKIVVNTTGMWDELPGYVTVEFFKRVQLEATGSTYYKLESEYRLTRHTLMCQWTSYPSSEKGTVLSFGNLLALSSASHPTHRDLETYETLESPEWR